MPSMHAMRWALAVVAAIAAFLLGSHLGARGERDQLATELASHKDSLNAIEQDYQAQVTQLRTQRDIADASNQSLQEKLKQLQSQSLEQKSAQTLYDKIEGTNTSSGLGVDTITRVNNDEGDVVELHVTVVQARGRNRVKGRIGLALVGEKNDSNWREVIVQADAKSAPRFDMRFFQTVVVPIPEEDIHIDFVEISVKPDGKTHKPFTSEVDWSSIVEE